MLQLATCLPFCCQPLTLESLDPVHEGSVLEFLHMLNFTLKVYTHFHFYLLFHLTNPKG